MSWKTVLMLLFFTSLEICWTPKESKYNTFFKKLYNAIQWNLVSKYSSRCAIFALSFILVNCFYQRLFWLFFFFQKNLYFKNKAAFFPALTNFPLALHILVIALVVALSVYKFPNKSFIETIKEHPPRFTTLFWIFSCNNHGNSFQKYSKFFLFPDPFIF